MGATRRSRAGRNGRLLRNRSELAARVYNNRRSAAGSNRSGRRNSPSISWRRKFRLKRAVKGARSAPPAAVETLDSPFQSEKVRYQEIDGEWRRPGRGVGSDSLFNPSLQSWEFKFVVR
jgi:hypothetical protein